MAKDMATQHLPQNTTDLVDYPEKLNEDNTLCLNTLAFPIEKLSVSARLPPLHKTKTTRKKYKQGSVLRYLKSCLTKKGF